jgi:hypothetical protein
MTIQYSNSIKKYEFGPFEFLRIKLLKLTQRMKGLELTA